MTYWCPLCQQRQDPLVPAWARADAPTPVDLVTARDRRRPPPVVFDDTGDISGPIDPADVVPALERHPAPRCACTRGHADAGWARTCASSSKRARPSAARTSCSSASWPATASPSARSSWPATAGVAHLAARAPARRRAEPPSWPTGVAEARSTTTRASAQVLALLERSEAAGADGEPLALDVFHAEHLAEERLDGGLCVLACRRDQLVGAAICESWNDADGIVVQLAVDPGERRSRSRARCCWRRSRACASAASRRSSCPSARARPRTRSRAVRVGRDAARVAADDLAQAARLSAPRGRQVASAAA